MTRRRIVSIAVLTTICGLACARGAFAQDVPVLFIHGIFANGDPWRATSARLATTLRITPYVVDLPSTDTLDSQTARLNAMVAGLPAQTIAVGHSQGGLIARQSFRSRPYRGILTLGTPHAGTPLAQNGLDVIKHHSVAYNLAGLIGSFGSGQEFSWVVAAVYAYLRDTQVLTSNVVGRLVSTAAVVNYVPVAPQLAPRSAFLSDLNGPVNLSREDVAGIRRASLVYTADQYFRGGVGVGLAPDSREWVWALELSAPPLLEYGAALIDANYGVRNWLAHTVATQLLTLAAYVRDMDPLWCWAVTGDRSCQVPHDGIVPVPSQMYPHGTSFAVYGPAHIQERQKSDGPLSQVLTTAMGIQPRGASPPPPPPPPSSSGADVLAPGQTLRPDQQVFSANGQYRLLYQTDGNLVLYGPTGAIWASDTTWASAGMVAMQGDGNFVIYDASGEAAWSSDTFEPGSYLRVHDDGGLQIVSAGGVELWWSGSGGF